MNNLETMPGIYPGVVKSYIAETRLCRVEIPGVTDGADVLPLAEICYPIGDKSKGTGSLPTEIEILVGDHVWITFIGCDPRYPLITGWRNPQIGNSVSWRRFHHANIELTAEGTMKLNATTIELNATDVNIVSKVNITGAELKHNSKNVGSTHQHSNVTVGSSNTGSPV